MYIYTLHLYMNIYIYILIYIYTYTTMFFSHRFSQPVVSPGLPAARRSGGSQSSHGPDIVEEQRGKALTGWWLTKPL